MKRHFTFCLSLSYAIYFLIFISCNDKNTKNFTASVASSENISALSKNDLKFVFEAYSHSLYNIQLSTEASIRSTATESALLADNLLSVATEVKQSLADVAAKHDLSLPLDLTNKQKELWKSLVKQKGWDFDKTFSNLVDSNLTVYNHLLAKAGTSAEDALIKDIALKGLNELKKSTDLLLAEQAKIEERLKLQEQSGDEEENDSKKGKTKKL